MFSDLIKALDHSLKPGQTIGLRKLAQRTGLSIGIWAERLKSPTVSQYIKADLKKAGFTYSMSGAGRGRSFTFKRLTDESV